MSQSVQAENRTRTQRERELVAVVQELSTARDLARVQEIVRSAARRLVEADGATFVLREEGMCFYADEDAIEPLWKGSRFPLENCISGWAMLNKRAAAIPDIYRDARIPHDAYRPTFVRSLVMVPIRQADPLGAIGTYWADERDATPHEIETLQALADSTSLSIQTVALWEQLEARVLSRTAHLAELNQRLSAEVEERRHSEQQALHLSMRDELTGIFNRRGLRHVGHSVLASAPRSGPPALVLYVDVDNLKTVNDTYGHAAGSQLLVAAADVLRTCFREGDVIGRIGGDEFAVLIPGCSESADEITRRVAGMLELANSSPALKARLSLSLGYATATSPTADVDELLHEADLDMYARRTQRRAEMSSR